MAPADVLSMVMILLLLLLVLFIHGLLLNVVILCCFFVLWCIPQYSFHVLQSSYGITQLWFHYVLPITLFLVALWSLAGKGLSSWLFLCVIFSLGFVTFPYCVLGQVWYLIVSIPDRWLLPYFQ